MTLLYKMTIWQIVYNQSSRCLGKNDFSFRGFLGLFRKVIVDPSKVLQVGAPSGGSLRPKNHVLPKTPYYNAITTLLDTIKHYCDTIGHYYDTIRHYYDTIRHY